MLEIEGVGENAWGVCGTLAAPPMEDSRVLLESAGVEAESSVQQQTADGVSRVG